MNRNHRIQMLYQKTDFNHYNICQMNGIFRCCKCKKNNSLANDNRIINNHLNNMQLCLFCGTPNSIQNKK
jgi:hypothetical protein